jgi:hypothetical protein
MQVIPSGLQTDSTPNEQYPSPSKWLILRAWFLLFYFELLMLTGSLKTVHRLVRSHKVRSTSIQHMSILSRAVDLACVFYFKRVLCLQRSAATTLLMRQYGWNAEMVIGVQLLPFQSHAWVEIQGTIVNDRPYLLEIYEVLERC